jgi:hypothetical protein
LAPGVYGLPSFPNDFLRQCWVAVLGTPGAAVAAFAAAVIHRFEGFRPGRPEIVVPFTSTSRCGIARVHRFDGALMTQVAGLRVTTRAQTLFDVAGRAGFDATERALDPELLAGRLALSDLEERLRFYKGTRRKGLPVMRALVDERREDGWLPPASELERIGDRVLKRLVGNPEVVREASFAWLKRGKGRVDRYLPTERIIVEFDGRRWHARLRDFDEDRWRDNLIVSHGLVPLRFTYAHLTTSPGEVLAIIEQTRRERRRAA